LEEKIKRQGEKKIWREREKEENGGGGVCSF